MAYEIIDNYFSSEEEDEAAQVDAGGFTFDNTQQNVPSEGFSFQ